MAIGQMRESIEIKSKTITFDTSGFQTETYTTVLSARAYVEGRHGSSTWKNRAAFTNATDSFTIRKPGVTITTAMLIDFNGKTYTIESIEDVKGRGMYLEILAKVVEKSGQHSY